MFDEWINVKLPLPSTLLLSTWTSDSKFYFIFFFKLSFAFLVLAESAFVLLGTLPPQL